MKRTILYIILLFLFKSSFSQSIPSIIGKEDISKDKKARLYYYFVKSVNGTSTLSEIKINLLDFNEGSYLKVWFINILKKDTIKFTNIQISNQAIKIPINNLFTGIYYLRIVNANNIAYDFKDKLLFFEDRIIYNYKQELDVSNLPFEFSLTYNNSNYPNSVGTSFDTIMNYVKESIKRSWIKENNEWGFCDALPNNTINVKKDTFQVFLDNQNDIWRFNNDIYFSYRGQEENSMESSSLNTRLVLTSDYYTWASCYKLSLYNEKSSYQSTISHELLHSIQSSYINTSFDSIEKANRKWHREGQARFLQTVVMGEPGYTCNGLNILFLNKQLKPLSLYSTEVDSFMKLTLKYQTPPKLSEAHYNYPMFWRHIYDHNFNSGANGYTKMALVRETMRTLDTSHLPSVKTHMDAAFRNANGKFKTFDEAIIDFAQRVVFYNKSWKDSTGALLNNWEDPNGTNFYNTELQII
jgi:hypothetical protein